MSRHVALLRAINVGGHVVKMDSLRQLFDELGFRDVTTHIASGNVLFTAGRSPAAGLETKIETALAAALGYGVDTFLRSPAELASVAAHEPFPPAEGASLYVGFVKEPLDAEAQNVVHAFRTPVDDFAVLGREVYWLCRIRSSDSEFSGARFEKALRRRATFRNVTTVRKLAALANGGDAQRAAGR